MPRPFPVAPLGTNSASTSPGDGPTGDGGEGAEGTPARDAATAIDRATPSHLTCIRATPGSLPRAPKGSGGLITLPAERRGKRGVAGTQSTSEVCPIALGCPRGTHVGRGGRVGGGAHGRRGAAGRESGPPAKKDRKS